MSGPPVQQTVIGDRNIFTGVGDVNVTYALAPSEGEDRHNLLTLLGRVKSFWVDGRLEGVAHSVALLALRKKTLPEAVEHPWGSLLGAADMESCLLPSGKKIAEVFAEAGRLLLILGEAGSGKTTTMLELTRDLIEAARADPTLPVPVVFHLSSWAGKRQSIHDWLVEELRTKYYIPARLGSAFLKSNRLLPLLDGLDEVSPAYRGAGVEAINHFVQEVGVPGLVVCSRLHEYTALPRRLRVNGAVCLMALSDEQVDEHLADAGDRLASLRALLGEDEVLRTLAVSPLMLDVMGTAYQGLAIEDLRGEKLHTADARRGHIFETYTQRMFERKGKSALPYGREQTTRWLTWLAENMRAHSQSIFLIERLQPSWLPGRGERKSYVLASRVAAGLLLGVACGLGQLRGTEPWWDKIGLFLLNPAVGLILGLFASAYKVRQSVDNGGQAPARVPPSYWRLALRVFDHTVVAGLAGAYLAVLMGWLWLWLNADIINSPDGPAEGFGSILLHILVHPSYDGTDLMRPFSFAAILALIGALIGLGPGFFFGLIVGIRDKKRALADDIQPAEILSWSRPRAKRAAIWGVLAGLLVGVVLGLLLFLYGLFNDLLWIGEQQARGTPAQDQQIVREIGLTFGLSYFAFALASGIFAFVFGLWGALVRGLNTGSIAETEGRPNHGIKSSLRNSLWAALIVGGSWALLDALVRFIQYGWAEALASSFTLLISVGLVAGLGYGGTDIIKHYTLRLLLHRRGRAPRKFETFLEHAVRLGFMRRVGGGYIFFHSLLRDHFADLPARGATAPPDHLGRTAPR